MTEFVFLPDDDAEPAASLAALGAVVAPVATGIVAMAMHPGAPAPRARASRSGGVAVRVLKVAPETGAALCRAQGSPKSPPPVPGGKLHRVVRYEMATAMLRLGRSRPILPAGPVGSAFLTLTIRSAAGGAPIAGALATLRLKGATMELRAVSDASGVVTFGIRAPAVEGAMLLVEPGFAGHWGFFSRKFDFATGAAIELDPVDLSGSKDCLRHLIVPGEPTDGTGVVVAVVDSGVGPHPDLPTALGDPDSSIGHGTHVAGIVAGAGQAGLGGVAPGASIRSYRVFDDAATGVTRNFEVHQAILKAISDGCHIINLSLKTEKQLDPEFDDPVISLAIARAVKAGVLVVAAAGNDFRRFVAFPARHPDVISVSAVGWEPGLPKTAYDRWTISTDRSASNGDIYFATFSNEGDRVDMTAPGAGVVSTVPGNRYAPMSGTSMACPAAVGAIARLLSANPQILAMPPDKSRYEEMRRLVFGSLKSIGFAGGREGKGMIA